MPVPTPRIEAMAAASFLRGTTRAAVLQAPLRFLPRVLHDAGFVVERWAYVDHATAHAASAFYASPFSSALTIVSDGTMSKLE